MKEEQIISVNAAEERGERIRQRKAERAAERRRSRSIVNKVPGVKIAKVAGVVAVALLVGEKLGLSSLIDVPGVDVPREQVPGKTEIFNVDIEKLRIKSTDALGQATVRIAEVKQEIVDKPKEGKNKPNVHETIYYTNGKYTAEWVSGGVWQPEKHENGDVTITIGAVSGNGVKMDENQPPTLDESRTGRAFWQKVGGIFGSDTQTGEIVLPRIEKALSTWVNNPVEAETFYRSTGCVALASAAEKAKAVQLGGDVNVDSYYPPRAEKPEFIETAPTLRFQIPDPITEGEMMTLQSCLTILDDLAYDTQTGDTSEESAFGLATHSIDKIILDPFVQ